MWDIFIGRVAGLEPSHEVAVHLSKPRAEIHFEHGCILYNAQHHIPTRSTNTLRITIGRGTLFEMDRVESHKLHTWLTQNSEWTTSEDQKSISRELTFATFDDAFDFMMRLGPIIKHINHHPEWSNTYNKVTIALTTHEADGISSKDLDLAASINSLASEYADLK